MTTAWNAFQSPQLPEDYFLRRRFNCCTEMATAWKAFQSPQLPEDYFRAKVIIFRYIGIELHRDETLLYSVLSKLFLFVTAIVFSCVEIYEIFAQWGNLNVIIAVSNYLITHILGAIKVGILFYNRKKIGQMMKSLHKKPFKPDETRGGKQEASLIRAIIRKTEIQLVVYFSTAGTTLAAGCAKAVTYRYTTQPADWIFPFSPTMSFGTWIQNPPYFDMGIFYQTFGMTTFAMLIASTDVLLSTIMAHISIQMKILGNTFRDMKKRAESMAGPMRNDKTVIDQNMNTLMREAVDHHLKSISLADKIENLCSLMILTNFIAGVILLCFLLYSASLHPIGSVEFCQYLLYWWIINFQIGMYCFWGNEVTLESDNVAKAAAEVDWPGSSKSITHALIMIIGRAQRPLYITAGKFVPLSMEVFVNIVKGSISYFMVLRQTQGMDKQSG